MLSVIVCTYNRDAYIYKTLEAIALNDVSIEDYELLVINNNCTDNTESECRRFRKDFPNVNYSYILETQQGLSYARNRGIAEAHGNVYVFVDDDAYVQSNYLKYLKVHVSEYPDMMAFGGKILPLFESGKKPNWMSRFLMPIISTLDKGQNITSFSGNSYPIGANMGFRKECIEQVGLFNTALGRTKKNMLGGEEKDIFERLRQRDMKIMYFPRVVVQHVIPASRTTLAYVKKFGFGAGVSEKVRCSGKPIQYLCSLFKECVKWGGTFVLSIFYVLVFQYSKAFALLAFRWNVTKGLLSRKKYGDD